MNEQTKTTKWKDIALRLARAIKRSEKNYPHFDVSNSAFQFANKVIKKGFKP